MLSKFVAPGNRIELQTVDHSSGENQEADKKIYYSKVFGIITEDRLEISMPMEKTKLVLLPVDGEYNLVIYGNTGLFQCFARIIERYKSNNAYLLVMELTSNLRKYQRREYYRFSCALEMTTMALTEEEIKQISARPYMKWGDDLKLKRSIIVDLSGGGLRFMATQKYDNDTILYCSYHLLVEGERKKYDLMGKVLSARELENRPGTYEHRVEFINMNEGVREEIIRYIFEEERKNRKKEKLR